MSKQTDGLRALAHFLDTYPQIEAGRQYPDQPLDVSFVMDSHEAVDAFAKIFNIKAEHPGMNDLYWAHADFVKEPNEYFPGVRVTASHQCNPRPRTRPRTCYWGLDAE